MSNVRAGCAGGMWIKEAGPLSVYVPCFWGEGWSSDLLLCCAGFRRPLCEAAPLRSSFIDTRCTWPYSNDSWKS
jgi:hypothetical protein